MAGIWTLIGGGIADAADLASAMDSGSANPTGALRFLDADLNALITLPVSNPAFAGSGPYALADVPMQAQSSASGAVAYVELLDRDRDVLARAPAVVAGLDGGAVDLDRYLLEADDYFTVRSLTLAQAGGSVTGDGAASIFTDGDRNQILVAADSDLAGACCFCRAAGTRVAVACEASGRVVVVDALEPRRIQVIGRSALLSPPPVHVASTDDYIFAFCQDGSERALVILSNAETPVEQSRVALERYYDDDSAWLALQETAAVLAYPVDRGAVAIMDVSTLEELGRTYVGVVNSHSAAWKRFSLSERPADGSTENKKFLLYVKPAYGSRVGVAELNTKVVSGATTLRLWTPRAPLRLPDSRNSAMLVGEPQALILSGAVSGRGLVAPIFEGVRRVSDGSFVATWGYDNRSGVAIYQAKRTSGLTRNHLTGGVDQSAIPEVFYPGRIRRALTLRTDGRAVTWELEPPSGGGAAPIDYAREESDGVVDGQRLYTFNLAGELLQTYLLSSPDVVEEAEEDQISADDAQLQGITIQFGESDPLPHTRAPLSSGLGISRHWSRAAGIRIEAGYLLAHPDGGLLTKYAPPALARESARGVLFSLPAGSITEFPLVFQNAEVIQTGEQMGWEIGADASASIVALSAESYATGGFTSVGRVHIFKATEGGAAQPVDIVEPAHAGIAPKTGLQFSRFTEVNAAGDRLFVGAKGGDSIAVFALDASGQATHLTNMSWAEYTAMPAFERAHEARVSEDGTLLVLSSGDRFVGGASTVPGKVHVLYSDDNWNTFEARQVFSRPDADGTADGFTTLDCNADCSVLAIGAWRKNKVYAFRTSDNWETYTAHTLPIPAQVSSGSNFGITMAVAADGFRIAAGAPAADWDQGFGAKTNNGLVAIYTWDIGAEEYEIDRILAPADELPGGAHFGNAVRFNSPGDRLSVVAGGIPRQYLFGISGDDMTEIARLDNAFVGGSADTRWAKTRDALIVANKQEDNGALTNVGAFRIIDFPEAP